MDLLTIFVDGDSCPKLVREYLLFELFPREGVELIWVGCSSTLINDLKESTKNLSSIDIVELTPQQGREIVDEYLIATPKRGDLVITRDTLLAERLCQKEIGVLTPYGEFFSLESVRKRSLESAFHTSLAQGGFRQKNNKKSYSKREFNFFCTFLVAFLSKK